MFFFHLDGVLMDGTEEPVARSSYRSFKSDEICVRWLTHNTLLDALALSVVVVFVKITSSIVW